MSAERVKDLKRRALKAFERRDRMKALYRDAQRLGAPHREGWDNAQPGRDMQREVYDSTFQDSVDRLANALFVGMVPPWLTWVGLTAGSMVPEEQTTDVKRRLQSPTRIVAQTLLRSGFYSAAHPVLTDLVFGTGAFQVDEDDRRVVGITAIPIHELGIEEGLNGKVDSTFRRRTLSGRNAGEALKKASNLPPALAASIRENPDSDVTFLSCCTPEERSGRRRWVQDILWDGSDDLLLQQEYYENPVTVIRWSVLSGEVWGRGPALKTCANAYTLNEAARLVLIAANLSIYGMWTSTDAGLNGDTVKFGPGAILNVNSNDNGNPSIRELNPSTRLDIGDWVINRYGSQVQRGLYRDNLGQVDGPRMTATEIVERQSLVLQDMGAAFGRISDEGIDPLVGRVVGALTRRGRLPRFQIDGELVALEYFSPLARAQTQEQANALRALMAEAVAVGAVDPTAVASIDTRRYFAKLAELTGADLTVLRDDAQMEEVMQRTADMAAATGVDPAAVMGAAA